MNKSRITSRPTGLNRIRSLIAFRHENPVARLVSVIAAFAVAMLLVGGTGAAYADDAAPSDSSTETVSEEPAAEETPAAEDTETPAAEESAPVEEPAPAEEPAQDGESADTPSSGPTVSKALATLAAPSGPGPLLVGNAGCESGTGTIVGGFQIDGDPCDEGGLDFDNGPGDTTDDPFGDADTTTFTGGSSESSNPATWAINGPKPAGKADIGTVWAYSHTWHNPDPNANDTTDGHVFAYFGFTNDSTAGGTQDYSLEYNQAAPVNGLPVRTPGDLLFHFFSNGSNELGFEAAYIYTLESSLDWSDDCVEVGTLNAGWCPFEPPVGTTLDDIFVSDASATGEFVEGSIDITLLFGEGNCSGTFGTTFLRSAPGSFWTSQMKDYVAPLGVTTPSTCGSLVITKTDIDSDAAVAGAVFGITGDPRPGGDAADTYCVFDGIDADKPTKPVVCDFYDADGTADGTVTVDPVEPGTYTVTELVAPPGYLLDPVDNSETVTVDEGETQPVTFANHRQWSPLDVSKTADGHVDVEYFWDITKQIAPTADGPWSDHPDVGSPLVKTIESGGDTNLYYRVQVTEDHVDSSNYVVDGSIHVANPNPDTFPNDGAVHATIGESLAGCELVSNGDDFPITVDVPSGGADYAYTCDLGDTTQAPGDNTATLTWDRSDYPQSSDDLLPANADEVNTDTGVDAYTFEETSTNETITVEDDHYTFDPAWVITWGDDAEGTYDSPVYSFDTEAVDGTCSAVITNTATATGDADEIVGQTSENGQVCVSVDLQVDVDASASLTRTYLWDIDKSTSTPTLTNTSGSVTAHYQVIVTALPFVDSAWELHGTVTVTNPNAFAAEQVSDLDVAYSGGGACVLDDPLPNVAASGNALVDFHCTFGVEPDIDGEEVTATVKWDGDAKSSTDPTPWQATWDMTLVDEFVKVFDDHAVPGVQDPLFGGVQLKWSDVFASADPAAHQVAVEYDHVYTGGALPAAGACTSLVNTAWITGDDTAEVLASDTATVGVCTPAVVVSPPAPPQQPHPHVLPNTGGPNGWLIAGGLGMLLAGGTLVLGDQRRKRRS